MLASQNNRVGFLYSHDQAGRERASDVPEVLSLVGLLVVAAIQPGAVHRPPLELRRVHAAAVPRRAVPAPRHTELSPADLKAPCQLGGWAFAHQMMTEPAGVATWTASSSAVSDGVLPGTLCEAGTKRVPPFSIVNSSRHQAELTTPKSPGSRGWSSGGGDQSA